MKRATKTAKYAAVKWRLEKNKIDKWRKNKYKDQGGLCYYCGILMLKETQSVSSKSCTLDHMVPLVLGGENHWENVVVCCYRCNQKKGTKTAEQYVAEIVGERVE